MEVPLEEEEVVVVLVLVVGKNYPAYQQTVDLPELLLRLQLRELQAREIQHPQMW